MKSGRGLGGRRGKGEGREPVDKGLQPPFHPLVINLSLTCHQHVIISLDALKCKYSGIPLGLDKFCSHNSLFCLPAMLLKILGSYKKGGANKCIFQFFLLMLLLSLEILIFRHSAQILLETECLILPAECSPPKSLIFARNSAGRIYPPAPIRPPRLY